MNEETKKILKIFFGPSTWTTNHPLDENRFFDFIATAYKYGDKGLSQDNLENVAKEMKGDSLIEHEIEKLGHLHSIYLDGINIIDKYVQII